MHHSLWVLSNQIIQKVQSFEYQPFRAKHWLFRFFWLWEEWFISLLSLTNTTKIPTTAPEITIQYIQHKFSLITVFGWLKKMDAIQVSPSDHYMWTYIKVWFQLSISCPILLGEVNRETLTEITPVFLSTGWYLCWNLADWTWMPSINQPHILY